MACTEVQDTCGNLDLLNLVLQHHDSALGHPGPVSLPMALSPKPRLPLISAAMESGPRRLQATAGALGEVQSEKNERIFTVTKSVGCVGHLSKTQSSSCLKQFRNDFSRENCPLITVQCNVQHTFEDGGRASAGVQTRQNHKVVLIALMPPFVFFS